MTFTIMVLVVVALFVTSASAYIVNPDETGFLESVYDAWGGWNIPGPRFTNWNFTKSVGGDYLVSPCTDNAGEEWEYITCTFGSTTAFIKEFNYANAIDDTFVLSSTIPSRLSSMTGLTKFSIADQALRGTIPAGVSSLTALVEMDLSGNSLSGTIPDMGDIAETLTSLSLSDNHFSGTFDANLLKLTKMETLHLQGNSIGGSLPTSLLSTFPSLQSLNLAGNSFFGSIPTAFFDADTNALTTLGLDSNSLTGTIPDMSKVTSLEILEMGGNSLVGTLPSSIFTLTTLSSLDVGHNSLSGWLSSNVGQLTKLMVLDVGGNNFYGTLPDLSGFEQNIVHLDLAGNAFTGPFPSTATFGTNTSNLAYVELGDNQFDAGPIPVDLLLPSLTHMDISKGGLTGPIPVEFRHLTNLAFLKMQDNSLTGSLPYQMEEMSSLVLFDVSSNLLTGVVDLCDSLTDGALEELIVTGNDFNCYAECWVGESNRLIYNSDTSGDNDHSILDFCQWCPVGSYTSHYYHNQSDPNAGDGYMCTTCANGKYNLNKGSQSADECIICPWSRGLWWNQMAGDQCWPALSAEKSQWVGGTYFEVGSFLIAATVGGIGGLVFGALIFYHKMHAPHIFPMGPGITIIKVGCCGFATISGIAVALALVVSPIWRTYGLIVLALRLVHIFVGSYIVLRAWKITEGRSFSARSEYEDLIDQVHMLDPSHQCIYVCVSAMGVLEMQFLQMLPWLDTEYASKHQGWPDQMTYLGVTVFKLMETAAVSLLFMLFVSFTDNTQRGDSLLALIAMYIMSAGLLILYNMGVELLMFQNSCSIAALKREIFGYGGVEEGKGASASDKGSKDRTSVFVDMGAAYRASVGFGGTNAMMTMTGNPIQSGQEGELGTPTEGEVWRDKGSIVGTEAETEAGVAGSGKKKKHHKHHKDKDQKIVDAVPLPIAASSPGPPPIQPPRAPPRAPPPPAARGPPPPAPAGDGRAAPAPPAPAARGPPPRAIPPRSAPQPRGPPRAIPRGPPRGAPAPAPEPEPVERKKYTPPRPPSA